MIHSLLMSSLFMAVPPASAVFVDDVPSMRTQMHRLVDGTLPTEEARRRLAELATTHGRRLMQVSPVDPDLFMQIDDALATLLQDYPSLAQRETDLADPLRSARHAATRGATASAARWLDALDDPTPLARALWRGVPGPNGADTLMPGDTLPGDLVARPMWARQHAHIAAAPLLIDDTIVLAGPGRLMAFDALAGDELWFRDNVGGLSTPATRVDGALTCAAPVHGGDIVVWLGRPSTTGFEGTGQVMRLNTRTGAVHWSWLPEAMHPDAPELRPSGRPLVTDAAVFVPLRRHGRAMDVESWIVALDLETGTPRWHRYLGTAASEGRGVHWMGDAVRAHGNSVLVQTGTGVIASLDPRDGGVDWLRRLSPGRWSSRNELAPPAWSLDAPVPCGDLLVLLAPDRSALLWLHPDTGEVVHVLDNTMAAGPHDATADMAAIVLSRGGNRCFTMGRTIRGWTLTPDGLRLDWSHGPLSSVHARGHLAGDVLLAPDGEALRVVDVNTGELRLSVPGLGSAHVAVHDGLLAASANGLVTTFAGLDDAMRRLTARTEADPDDVISWSAVTLLAASASRADLVRDMLPTTVSRCAPLDPPRAVHTLVTAIDTLDAELPSDVALIDAAINVLRGGDVALNEVFLAQGDWLEAASPDAAVAAWLQAALNTRDASWVREDTRAAPVEALVARRLERHGLEHAVQWPPGAASPGARVRCAWGRRSPARADTLAVLSAAPTPRHAWTAARLGGLDETAVAATAATAQPAIGSSGATRHLQGAMVDTPGNEGLLLVDGSTLTWHESPMVDAAWKTAIEGTLAAVIAINPTQVVIVVDRFGGGRTLMALDRGHGQPRWSRTMDQLGDQLDPPVVAAANSNVAALATRSRMYLVNLHDGTVLDVDLPGRCLAATPAGDHLVLLTSRGDGSPHTLRLVDAEARVHPWPGDGPPLPRAHWLACGDLGEIVIGDDTSVAFAPGSGEPFWWRSRVEGPDALRGAVVLDDRLVARTLQGELLQFKLEDGMLLGPLERPDGARDAPLLDLMPTGDGLYVVRDASVARHDARGELIWGDVAWDRRPPPTVVAAGEDTFLLQEDDVLTDVLLATEARVTHQVRRLDAHGRLKDALDLFPIASRIRRARPSNGMLLVSDDLDTWLLPLPDPPDHPN